MNIDLKAFRDFCAAKPADERYTVVNARKCPMAQFGFPDCQTGDMPKGVWEAICGEDNFTPEATASRTWGALTSRLEALLPLEPLLPFEHPPIEGSGFPDEVKS